MAKKPRRWRGTAHGSKIPQRRVWVCKECSNWHPKTKPTFCQQCGHNAFHYFMSTAEAKRFGELDLLRRAGQVKQIECQHAMPLHAGEAKTTLGKYVADFVYWDEAAQRLIYEDVKGGADTEMSKSKRRHAEAEYGVTIKVIRR